MGNFDLKKYLVEGELNKTIQPYYVQMGIEKEVEDIAYYLDMFKNATDKEEALGHLATLEYTVSNLSNQFFI
jgi:hypothetical protein